MKKYKVVDLFAGAGGLSLGFVQTGKYDIKVAFENNPNMQNTYRKNHPKVDVRGDVCAADYSEIKRKYGAIDVVIGGPPCQGFSNANRQKNTAVSLNNKLVKQYVRAILELKPKAFIMENVSMLKSEVHRFYLEQGDEDLIEEYGIKVKLTPLKLLDEEYCFDEVLDIIRFEDRISMYIWPEQLYQVMNVIYKITKNPAKLQKALEKHRIALLRNIKDYIDNHNAEGHISDCSAAAFEVIKSYYDNNVPASDIKKGIENAIMLQRMLFKSLEIINNHILVDEYSEENGLWANIRSMAVFDYIKAILESPKYQYKLNSTVLCAADYGAPQKRMRFVIMGIRSNISSIPAFPMPKFEEDEYRTVRDAISDIEDVEPVVDIADDIGIVLEKKELNGLAKKLRNSKKLYNHIITDTTETAMKRFKAIGQGQNFHSLSDDLKSNTYTDPKRTQNTIYTRLKYDEPCGTVVNVRKSMWIHPTKDRALSIREAARLQTFPDSFVFCGSKDQQYQQVGNAVPPIMARAIALKLNRILEKANGRQSHKRNKKL